MQTVLKITSFISFEDFFYSLMLFRTLVIILIISSCRLIVDHLISGSQVSLEKRDLNPD